MRRNDFNKQIEVYSIEPVSDGFGGNTTTSSLVDTRWAKIAPNSAGSAQTESGLEDANRSMVITIRKNGLALSADNFIKYRGVTYKITSGPTEIGFDNRFYEFTCRELITKSN